MLNKIWLLALGLAVLSSSVLAAPVTVNNPGFEADVNAPNTFTFGAPADWLPYNAAAVTGETIGTLNPTGTTYFSAGQWAGGNVGIAYMDVAGTAGVEFGIRQILSATLQTNTIYTLDVGVGNIASGTSDLGGGDVFFNLDGFPGYRVELRAGNTLLAADANTLIVPEAEFRTSQVVFNSAGVDVGLLDQQLEIRLVNLNLVDSIAPDAHREVDFEDVNLDATVVPIPPALVFLVTGLAVLSVRRRA